MKLGNDFLNTLAERHASHFKAHAQFVADKFRRIAEDIEREIGRADRPRAVSDEGRFGYAASQMHHVISWGLANSRWDHLAEKAALADVYRVVADGVLDNDEEEADGG